MSFDITIMHIARSRPIVNGYYVIFTTSAAKPIRVFQELSGHADVKTMEIYTHVMARDIRHLESPLDRI